jgi:hypothetical protein
MGDWLATLGVLSFCAAAGVLTFIVVKLSDRADRRDRERSERASAAPESR